MFEKKITFDRFVRGGMIVALIVGAVFLIRSLSNVLWPFFVAWIGAYLLYPLVSFLERRCYIRWRVLSILLSLLLIFVAITAFGYLTIPQIIEQYHKVSDDLQEFTVSYFSNAEIPVQLQDFINHNLTSDTVVELLQRDDVISAVQMIASKLWDFMSGTGKVLMGVVDACMVMLYMFFILMDYERLSNGWFHLVPAGYRNGVRNLVGDVKREMNAYFRGQGLIAFLVGVLFALGFTIIDFPMAIALGLLIGAMNMVPYLQLAGFIPTVLLAALKAADTSESFWVILACAFAVFCVVQAIQDLILTPKILGHVMGLKPAVILLSLSVWGSLLGLIGLIIALPLTTLACSYYKRFVLKEQQAASPKENNIEQ